MRIVCPGEIEFADDAVEAAVRDEINKPDGAITYQDISTLTELNVEDQGVSDLGGMECLQELTWLNLSHNDISDLEPLSGLHKLEDLNLRGNNIDDVAPLAGLTSLMLLTLQDNDIENIRPLLSNRGLGEGDWVNLLGNPLACREQEENIQALEDRGVLTASRC